MNVRYPQVAARAAHRCEYCRAPEVVFNFPFEIDHVLPRGIGGDDGDSNLALACRACNLLKSNATTAIDDVSGEQSSLFNPRTDSWNEHFEIVGQNQEIHGLTARGRATVARLQLNRLEAVSARLQWVRLGLFP